MNKKSAERSEGREVRSVAAMNGVTTGSADDQPTVKLGSGENAAAVGSSTQNRPPRTMSKKETMIIRGEEHWRGDKMDPSGRGGGRTSYRNHNKGDNKPQTTVNGTRKSSVQVIESF